MVNNKLVMMSFCISESREDKFELVPKIDYNFTKDTKAFIAIRSEYELSENAVIRIMVENEVIWESSIKKPAVNIVYAGANEYSTLYMSSKGFFESDVLDGINSYDITLSQDNNIIGRSSFQASVEEDNYNEVDNNSYIEDMYSDIEDIRPCSNIEELKIAKELMKRDLDSLVEMTETLDNKSYFEIVASQELIDMGKSVETLRKNIDTNLKNILGFYNR